LSPYTQAKEASFGRGERASYKNFIYIEENLSVSKNKILTTIHKESCRTSLLLCRTKHSKEGSVNLFRIHRQVSVAFSLNCRHVKDDKNFVSRKGNSDAAFGKISRICKCFH
jgi:hypothetical protein